MLHLSNLTHIIIMVLNKLHIFNILLLVRDLAQEPLLHHTFNILFSLRFGHLHLVYMKNGTELQCKGSAFFTPSLPPPLAPGPSFYFFPVCLSLSFCLRSNNSLPLSLQTLKWGLGFRLTLVSTTRLGFHPVREQENKQRHGGRRMIKLFTDRHLLFFLLLSILNIHIQIFHENTPKPTPQWNNIRAFATTFYTSEARQWKKVENSELEFEQSTKLQSVFDSHSHEI